jgi:hypothetical protein
LFLRRFFDTGNNASVSTHKLNVKQDRQDLLSVDHLLESKKNKLSNQPKNAGTVAMLNQLGTIAPAAATTATSLISEYTQATRRAVNHMLQLRESVLLNDWNQVSILLQQQNDENETITDPRDTPTLEQEERMIIQNEALRKVVLFKLTKALLNKTEGK